MKKLGILIYSLGSGGAERVISQFLPKLVEHYHVELFLMADIIHYEVPKEVKISFVENSSPYESGLKKLLKIFSLGVKYKKILEEREIDISLSFMNRPNYINVVSKILGSKTQVIISERAMPSLEYGGKDLKSRINQFLIKKLYPKADKIICNSLGNSEDLKKNFAVTATIDLLYNPINKSKIQKLGKEPCDFDFTKTTFVTIGRLDDGKNHGMMIDAFSQIDNKNSQLIIIGYGLLEEKLIEKIKDLHLELKVFLVGRQENPYKWLQRSDCFLFASKHEGFPNVILEAMVFNLPIIATNPHGVVTEILGEGGTIIKNRETMKKAMENIPKRSDYSQRLKTFELDNIFPKLLKILS